MGEGWDIRLCGPVLVDAEGRRLDAGLPGRQGRLLFAYLVLNRGRGCPRDELIDVLWPEGPPAAADSALSALLSKLRRALGDGVLTGRGELRLRLDGRGAGGHRGVGGRDRRRPSARWRPATTRSPPSTRAHALATDLQTFLPDAEGGWAAEQRRELETIRLRALETLAEAGLRQGGRELGAAEQAARAAIVAAPFRESAHRLLMEVHEAAGNPAEALRAFEELRSLLREELGTTPGPAAMAVFERVLRGEPPPVHRAAAPVVAAPGVTLGAVAVADAARRPRSTATRSSAAASSWPTSSAAGARRPRASARSSCSPATRASARPAARPRWPRAPTRTAPSCSTGASTRRR